MRRKLAPITFERQFQRDANPDRAQQIFCVVVRGRPHLAFLIKGPANDRFAPMSLAKILSREGIHTMRQCSDLALS